MGQIFNQEKKNIGIYKALGFNNKEILPLFLCVGVIVSFLSLIILAPIRAPPPIIAARFPVFPNPFSPFQVFLAKSPTLLKNPPTLEKKIIYHKTLILRMLTTASDTFSIAMGK